jgi:hypothetical protein
MSVRSAWFMNQAKFVASLVGSGSGSVAAAGDEGRGFGVGNRGVDGGVVVAGVAAAAGFDTAAFFEGFFLLEGAGIVFIG